MIRLGVLLMLCSGPLRCMASSVSCCVMPGAKQACVQIVLLLSMIMLSNWHAIIICNCVAPCSAMGCFSLLPSLMICASARLGSGSHWMELGRTMIVSVLLLMAAHLSAWWIARLRVYWMLVSLLRLW